MTTEKSLLGQRLCLHHSSQSGYITFSEVSKACSGLIQCSCNGDYTNCKCERANLACLLLCNCTYNNTIGITNGPAT